MRFTGAQIIQIDIYSMGLAHENIKNTKNIKKKYGYTY